MEDNSDDQKDEDEDDSDEADETEIIRCLIEKKMITDDIDCNMKSLPRTNNDRIMKMVSEAFSIYFLLFLFSANPRYC